MRWALFAAIGVFSVSDSSLAPRRPPLPPLGRSEACAGNRAPHPDLLLYELRSAPFPDLGSPSVAVHVPKGFDVTRRPGLVIYFHGWLGCVSAALADHETPCSEGGDPRPGASLAHQLDDSGMNALLVAIELRVDSATGEPGRLAVPGALRRMLNELFSERLAAVLGCPLEVDGLERIVVIAHSGGYQAAASALQFGDLPQLSGVMLLDGLYGADEAFTHWIHAALGNFDPRARMPAFVDLYTCCGGTLDRSRAMAAAASEAAVSAGWRAAVHVDDGNEDLDADALRHAVVFKRVAREHSELPRVYARELIESAGFARVADP